MRWERSFEPYVSAAERRLDAQEAAKALENKGQKLNPIRIDGQTIARSFWGKAWCKNLESYSDYANRLPRGRAYVRNGSVVDFVLVPGQIRGLVVGNDLYRVPINLQPVQKAEWKALKTDCAGRVSSLIELLQGKLSAQVMEIITRRETGLFPRPAEIRFTCSCPDWAGMCKHVAATLYAVGSRLDESPELLFELRGVDHLELVTEATESVTTSVVASGEDSATLAPENLEEVFGIEIEPSALLAAKTAVSKSKSKRPKRSVAGSRSEGPKTAGPRNVKVRPVDEARGRRKRAKQSPRKQ